MSFTELLFLDVILNFFFLFCRCYSREYQEFLDSHLKGIDLENNNEEFRLDKEDINFEELRNDLGVQIS